MTAELMRAASGRSLFLDHPLQRRYQDIQAGLGHAFLGPDPVARAVGGALLGTTHARADPLNRPAPAGVGPGVPLTGAI